jgi:hypothetical protein
MQHLEEGTIHAWLDGALPAEESAGVERHVAVCTECASLVAEARGMIAGASRIVSSLDIVPGGVIPKSSRATKSSGSLWRSLRFTPSRAALAATLVIAVSTVLTLRHDTDTKIVPTMSSNATAPVAAAIPAAAAPAPAKDEALVRQQPKAPTPSAVAEHAPLERRALADARTPIADSARSEPKSKPSADVAAANRAIVQGAAAPPAVSAVASGGGTIASDVSLNKVRVDSVPSSLRRISDSIARTSVVATQGFAARKADAARARESVALLSALNTNLGTGCYQLTDSAAKDKSLPARFALDLDRADPSAHIIRAVSADGVADTIIARASWQRSSDNIIDVRFQSVGKVLSLVIQIPAGSATGVAAITGDGAARTAAITRLTCR